MTVPKEALATIHQQLEDTGWKKRIQQTADMGAEMVEQFSIAESPEAKRVMQFLLAAAFIFRPTFRDPEHLAAISAEVPGGESYNPHFLFDVISDQLGIEAWKRSATKGSVELFTEEHGNIQIGVGRITRSVFSDACDGSKSAVLGMRDQASGMAVYDRRGQFIAAGIASLVHNTVLLVENGTGPRLLNFNEQTGDLHEFSPPKVPQNQNIHYETLLRRMTHLKETKLFQEFGYPSLATIGGYGVLMMMEGRQDVMIDPKGQLPPEAFIWLGAAQEYGLIVTSMEGTPIDIAHRVNLYVRSKIAQRIPVVINRTPEIKSQVTPLLQEHSVDYEPFVL